MGMTREQERGVHSLTERQDHIHLTSDVITKEVEPHLALTATCTQGGSGGH